MSFSLADVRALLRPAHEAGLVLIGGQALNFWVERYRPQVSGGPFTSKDLDFWGSRTAVTLAARAMKGEALRPRGFDAINAGLIRTRTTRGVPIEINVVLNVFGLNTAEVEETALTVELEEFEFRVLHPVLLLESRIANVNGLHRHDPHSIAQARVAVTCVRCFLEERAGSAPREVLRLGERIWRYARRDLQAKAVAVKYGIDPFDAVRPLPALPEGFRRVRYPQMRQALATQRT